MLAVAGGDRIAFAALYEQYRRKVYFIAWRMLGTETEAEDVQQEIFTKIWLGREKLALIEQFSSYLNTLIRNHVYNALRKKANETAYIEQTFQKAAAEPDEPFRAAEINQLQSLLRQAISRLPAQQQKVFELVRIEGRPHKEVAGLLGVSKETIKKHMMEAQRKIKAFFDSQGLQTLIFILSQLPLIFY